MAVPLLIASSRLPWRPLVVIIGVPGPSEPRRVLYLGDSTNSKNTARRMAWFALSLRPLRLWLNYLIRKYLINDLLMLVIEPGGLEVAD
jgi:hypothetical protein